MKAPYGVRTGRSNAILLIAAMFLLLCGEAQAKTIRILVLGDSLAAGYGLAQPDGFQARMTAALRARGHDVTLIDAAVSGDTSAGGRARLDWALADGTPEAGADAALVELGANDGLRGLDPAAMEANLGAILDALAARHIPVLLTGMEAPPNMGAAYANAFRDVYARLGARPGIIFDPFFLAGIAGDKALNQDDHIHPNPKGVMIEVDRLVPIMEKLIAKVGA